MRKRASFLLARPGRILLLMSISVWYMIISILKPFLTLEKLISFVNHGTKNRPLLPLNDVMVMLHWLNVLRSGHGDCLSISLVGYRFLSLSGAYPVMVIGLKPPGNGHAWLENIDGNLLLEHQANIDGFTPVLRLKEHCLESIRE